jgi:hypothetical protein
MPSRDCVSAEDLRAYLLGDLPEPLTLAVSAHLETCADCESAAQKLDDLADPLIRSLQRALGSDASRATPPDPGDRATPRKEEPPPRIVGPLPQLASEIQTLLHQRLWLICLIFLVGWGLTWTHNLLRLRMTPDTVWFNVVPGGVLLAFTAAMAAILWAPRSLSLRRLRGYELVCYAVPVVFLLWENYFTIYRTGDTGAWMHRYVQRDLSEIKTLARHTSIVWSMAIVAYGIFVPNTLRRCATVTGSLACTVLAMNLVCGLRDEAIPRGYLFSYVAEMATWLVMAVGFSIYGSHKISVLRQQAFEARRLGQYRIKHRLGAGGMGEVYLAEHVLLRRPCALKLIRPEWAGDPTNLARFEREVQATATLTHPNIVEIFDYGRADDGTFYYAMEYLPGLSLHELVRRYGSLPPERAVHLLRQVCGALQEAHAAALSHRDVKPGNILVCQRGGQHEVAKLLDFGLVRAHGLAGSGEKLTQDGAIAGTPAYMSPEQAAGKADVDARSDLYSLGAVAYFLLTGRPPFVRDSAVQVLAAHLGEPVVAPDRHRPDVPADLQAVVLRCLEKDPACRFPNADELAKALARCSADQWTREQAAAWWRDCSVDDWQETSESAGHRT